MIILTNPGLIDPLTITTMGVSVKETDNPIGQFGTGLKYAIAVLLRNQCSISIESGGKLYTFSTRAETIRDKTFDVVLMNGENLGFTTALGKNWQPWMALRELYSNMKDEGGTWRKVANNVGFSFLPDQTDIYLSGEIIEQAYDDRSSWLLSTTPIDSCPSLEIHENPTKSAAFYYQGIKVGEFSSAPRFTYNLQTKITLTEDRTALSLYEYMRKISASIVSNCENIPLLNTILLLPTDTVEGNFFFASISYLSTQKPSDTFIHAVKRLSETHRGTVNRAALELCRAFIPQVPIIGIALSAFENIVLQKALTFLKAIDYDVTSPIIVVTSLGNHWIMGLAEDGTIYLPKGTFDKGTAYVAATILEEHLHITQEFSDCSREFQDYLLQKIITLGQQITLQVL